MFKPLPKFQTRCDPYCSSTSVLVLLRESCTVSWLNAKDPFKRLKPVFTYPLFGPWFNLPGQLIPSVMEVASGAQQLVINICAEIPWDDIVYSYDIWFCLGWKLQLDKYQGFNAFPAMGCAQWVWIVTTILFLVDRYFLGIKPADCTTLPKKHQHTCLKSKGRHGLGRGLNPWPPDNKSIALPTELPDPYSYWTPSSVNS